MLVSRFFQLFSEFSDLVAEVLVILRKPFDLGTFVFSFLEGGLLRLSTVLKLIFLIFESGLSCLDVPQHRLWPAFLSVRQYLDAELIGVRRRTFRGLGCCPRRKSAFSFSSLERFAVWSSSGSP